MSKKTLMPGTGLDLDNPNEQAVSDGPVECLGKTFANDAERREYYLQILAEKLKDPEFRKIEGFPIGEDIDILNLSDPPYYTACPNPFIADFIAHYGRPYDSSEIYKREPYASDVSEGKSDPIYNAHSYHTKVPHKAIMRYILHYTNPGDVVFDGFCGTGMTGVAAQMCGDRVAIEELGFKVLSDGTILEESANDQTGKSEWIAFSRLGARCAILNDISTVAGFISSNFNKEINTPLFSSTAKKILDEVNDECGWMFKTLHSDGVSYGDIKLTIWSDILICPECTSEFIFWDVAQDPESGKVRETFNCPSCASSLTKKKCYVKKESIFDNTLGYMVTQRKQAPVKIIYSFNGKRFEKNIDSFDVDLLNKIDSFQTTKWLPADRMMEGGETRRNDGDGITHIHHYYTKRNLIALSLIREKVFQLKNECSGLGLWFTSAHPWVTKLSRLLVSNYFKKKGGVVAPTLQGTMYVSSISAETNTIDRFGLRIKSSAFTGKGGNVSVSTTSTSELGAPDNSIDYLFVDPPFGANIAYSELNSLWESWLKVKTNIKNEAIENKPHSKSLNDYLVLIRDCFEECYRVLKPGRWMTVEFSNTKASVWNVIQTALSDSGFVVANVSILEKTHKGFRAVTTTTAVKQDLVISAYKPNGGFEKRFISETDEEGVWDFVRTHLDYLPVTKKEMGELINIPERDPRILFDQVIAYFVRNLRDVPLSSKEFQEGLRERFSERDGMIFLPEQVSQYDKVRMTSTQLRQLTIFVDDEASAIEWLRQLLNDKPQTYQDVHPKFIHELSGWKKAEMQLELSTLLEQNFLKFDGTGQIPAQIHSYLSTNFKEMRNLAKDDSSLIQKAKDRWYVPNPEREEDLQKLRERSLLKQFEEYKNHSGKKLKLIRMEAVRAGFKKAWVDRDYKTIIEVAEKIPEDLLQEDQKLLMWYDQAQTRHSDSSLF
jgi:DNA modification methylase